MQCNLKSYSVILLALLQFVAPLVHAHAGQKNQASGLKASQLHIPGLETFGAHYESLQLQTTNHGPHAEGFIISVDTGMKHQQVKLISDTVDKAYALPHQTFVFEPVLSNLDNRFLTDVLIYPSGNFILSRSPRAPPAL